MHPPTTPKQVCGFPGLVGYYMNFIKNFTKIAKPLTVLSRQQVKFEWIPEHQEAFKKIKDSIIQAPICNTPTSVEGMSPTQMLQMMPVELS